MKRALVMTRLSLWLLLATASSAQTLTPTVNSFTPTTISAGSPSFTLAVNGSAFLVGSVFLIWTPPGATSSLTAIAANAGATTTDVQFTLPATAVAASGTANF